jgi:hypothetical protein
MELRETAIDRLRKRLGRDPTEEEINTERDRKWRFALADMGITVECFLDEKADLPHGWQPPARPMRALGLKGSGTDEQMFGAE